MRRLSRAAASCSRSIARCVTVSPRRNGSVAPFLIQFKPANLTGDVAQSKTDGSIFLTISNGIEGRMPALNENLTVSERWDVVNFVRTLKLEK
ncbi:MAG: hypothetical protein U0X93_15840 [Anaerolineales bacterium]